MNRTRTCTLGIGVYDDCEGNAFESRNCPEADFTPGS